MPALNFDQLMQTADTAQDFKPLEDGEYEFEVDQKVEVKNENYRISVKLRVLEGPRKGATVFQNLTFDPNSKPYPLKLTFDFLEAVGLTRQQISQAGTLENIAGALPGRRLAASTTIREYTGNDGKPRQSNNLSGFRPATGTAPGGPAGPGAPAGIPAGGPTPGVPQAAPQAAPQAQAQAAPQAEAQPNPWAESTVEQTQPAAQPQSNFAGPPQVNIPNMPFG